MKALKRILLYLLKLFFSIAVIICCAIYFINFQVDGSLAFVSKNTTVYKTSELETADFKLKAGETFQSLSFSDNGATKIRYTDPSSGKELIGFIDIADCHVYEFSGTESTGIVRPHIILSVNEGTSFNSFVSEFATLLQEYMIMGVYLEVSEYSDDVSDISYFCESMKVPYGIVSQWSADSAVRYSQEKLNDEIENHHGNWSYKILPQVFDVDPSSTWHYNHFSDDSVDLSECIIRMNSTTKISNKSISNFWIRSNQKDTRQNNQTVLFSVLDEESNFEFVTLSTEFENELFEKYGLIEDSKR